MSVGSFGSFNFLVLALIVVVSAQNDPEFDYTCDEFGMHVDMTFDHPFRGLVYIKGYSKDAKCRLALQVPALKESFNVPLMACGMFSPQFPGSSPWLTGIIVVQHHPLIPTINDTSEPVACAVEISSNTTNWSEVSRQAQEFLNHFPDVISWLEFGLAPGIFEKMVYDSNNTNFMAFRVYRTEMFNDMMVTECIAHDEPFITHNTSIHQMTYPNGCSKAFTETLSPFNVTKSDRGKIIGAYAEFNPLSIPNPENAFISCSAILCSDTCQCPQNSRALGYQLIATRKLLGRRYKRSTSGETSDPSNNRNYGIRNSLLRSTIKALTARLMNNRRQPRIEKEDADFEKRIMHNSDEVTTAKLITTQDDQSEPSFTERVPAIKIKLGFNSSIETQNFNERNISSANISAMFIPELELENIMTHLFEFSTESSLHHESTFEDSLSVTLIPEDEIEKMFHLLDKTEEDNLNPDENLKDWNEDQQNVLVEKKDDFISTVSVTTETQRFKPHNNTSVDDKQEQNDCVPRLRFVIVTASLSFIVVCLILGSCGLFLHMSKEKKKRAIDNFLLYNFY